MNTIKDLQNADSPNHSSPKYSFERRCHALLMYIENQKTESSLNNSCSYLERTIPECQGLFNIYAVSDKFHG